MEKGKVSVIIPAFNSAKYLSEAIASVEKQTYSNYEIIIVDDGSIDETEDIVNKYRSPKLKYIKHNINKGPSAARNTGISLSTGEFIAFLDADDIWLENKLEEQIKVFENNKNIALVYSDNFRFDENGKHKHTTMQIKKFYRGYIYANLIVKDFIPLLTVVVHKDILNKVGNFDESLKSSEDYDMWLRIAVNHTIDYVPKVLAGYRIHKSQSIQGNRNRHLYMEQLALLKNWKLNCGNNMGTMWILLKHLLRLHMQSMGIFIKTGQFASVAKGTEMFIRQLKEYGVIIL